MSFLFVLLLGLLAVSGAFVLGMRARSPRLLNAVRRFNRAVSNPRQMRSAGGPGAYASLIRHTGRTSGTPYETPVGAVATEDALVIALASGSAVIVREGHAYRVDRPQVLPIEAAAGHLSASDRRFHRLFGIDECLRARRVEPQGAAHGQPRR
jgi:hypothetical protein